MDVLLKLTTSFLPKTSLKVKYLNYFKILKVTQKNIK